jgi:hypothetical protein
MDNAKMPFHLFYLLIFITLFSNCSSNTKKSKNINEITNTGKKLMLPDSLVLYKPFNDIIIDSNKIVNSTLKIYSYMNVSCPSCLSSIKEWKNIASELKGYNIPIILICQSEDNYELFKYLCEKKDIAKFPFPFYFDVKNQFFIRNKFLTPNPNTHTVLTDKNNKILVSGDLTLSDKIKDLYIDAIKSNNSK